ncbi:MAG: type II toxin-antitoxin system HicA family toxin [Pseudomonadota bacterium]
MKTISGKEVCRLLERNGWYLVRVHGSHHLYNKPGISGDIGYLGTYIVFLPSWTLARSSRFPFAQVPTIDLLDLCHKRRISGRSPGSCPFSERDRLPVVRGAQKSLPIGDKYRQRFIGYERIIFGDPLRIIHVHGPDTTPSEVVRITGHDDARQTRRSAILSQSMRLV